MRSLPRRILSPTALGFALLDVPLQAIQGLLYDFEQRTWPTNVDLMDTMLLISRATGASQALLKGFLVVLAAANLVFF
jgi:hypothetical protein